VTKPELKDCIVETKKKQYYARIPNTGIKSFKFAKKEQAEAIAKFWLDNWERLYPSGGDRK
jgi:hypothetical protein